jgi:hypothetical protein
MADRRRFTGTKTLQTVWTVLVAAFVVVGQVVIPGLGAAVAIAGAGTVWLAGLVVLGLSERRHWQQLVAASSFERSPGSRTADLQQLRHGQSISVSTDVPGLLSQSHTRIRGTVEGVDASFTILIKDVRRVTDDDGGVATGDESLDERFHIEGSAGNVKTLLTTDVRDALLAVETPGTFEVTGQAVVYEVPFTRLTPTELEVASEAVAVLADRVENA